MLNSASVGPKLGITKIITTGELMSIFGCTIAMEKPKAKVKGKEQKYLDTVEDKLSRRRQRILWVTTLDFSIFVAVSQNNQPVSGVE